MRSSTIVIVACLLVCAHTMGQHITIHEKNIRLEKVFEKIRLQTGYLFLYSHRELQINRRVTLSLTDAPLEIVLSKCFAGQSVSYQIINKTIVLSKIPDDKTSPNKIQTTVKGIITGDKKPMESVSVFVKNTQRGTTTNQSGQYLLSGIDTNAILVISSVGYLTREILVGNRAGSDLDVELSPSSGKLDETLIIAYGTTTRRSNTGAVGKVTGADISLSPVANPLAAIEGRIPGLFITQNTGVPGGSFTIQLRGKNSISNGNDPLFIMDGVPLGPASLNSLIISLGITRGGSLFGVINPGDIESIEVLKDADATAIYGSRGSNGVIMITTKKGNPGKTKLDFNMYRGTGKITRNMELLNTPQYLEMRNEAFKNDMASPDPGSDYDLTRWDTTRYTNWQKLITGGTMRTTDAQVSVSGGRKLTKFYTGGAYHHETTVFPGDFFYAKLSGHFSVSHSSTNNKFQTAVSGRLMSEDNNLPSADITGQSLVIAPNAPEVYDTNGALNWDNGNFDNPFAILLTRYKADMNIIMTNASASYQLAPSLQVRTNIGFTKTHVRERSVYPGLASNPAYGNLSGSSYFSDNHAANWIIQPQLTYSRKIKHTTINWLTGFSLQQYSGNASTVYATGFNGDDIVENQYSASSILAPYSENKKYHYQSFFTRLNYNLLGKCILNLTATHDGSSRFGPGKQFAWFGAAGAAWVFSKEKLIRRYLPAMSFGKLRASFGITGNDQIEDYQFLQLWNGLADLYQRYPGLVPTRLFNGNYSWETCRKLEAALELGFFNDRILFNTSFYYNRSSNQLIGNLLSFVTGFPSVLNNSAALVNNSGLEIELTTINIHNKNFNWTSIINITFPRNKLITYPDINLASGSGKYVAGQSLFVLPSFHDTGIDPQTGIYQFEDKDNDGNISFPNDLYAYKQSGQRLYGGFQNSFRYRNWRADIFFQFVNQTGRNYLFTITDAPGTFVNQPLAVLDRWQKPGDMKKYQRFTQDHGSAAYSAFMNAYFSGDKAISDASFIRMKNICISYELPETLVQKWKLKNIKVYVQAQNMVTITNYEGIDPENQNLNILPPLKLLTMGIHLTL